MTYEYDKAGNRIKIGGSFARTGVPDSVSTTNYNAANQQTAFGDKTLTYDDNGNLTSITDSSGTTTYTWNARNQLTGISGPGVSASFVYDGLGRREKKTINSNLTEFLYGGLNPVQETSGSTVLANILPGLGIDEFLTRTDSVAGVTSSFLTDALGSPVAVTDNSGGVQTEYTYEPFGKTTISGSSNSNSYQYTGRENDGTGLYYYRARHYHPGLQRFISEDPFNIAVIHTAELEEFRSQVVHFYLERYFTTANLYSYVDNRPCVATDPLGLFCGALGKTLGQQIVSNVGIGGAVGAGAGAANTRKPVTGGAIGGVAGAIGGMISPLPTPIPGALPGAAVGGVIGGALGAAVGAAASGGQVGGAVAGALGGAAGGALGGAIGGHCGAIIGAGVGVGVGMAVGFGLGLIR